MKKITGNEFRQLWFDFWKTKGHEIIPSVPLIPKDDPTLLWINSGVAGLKKYFDGTLVPNNRRMAGSQKCIRTNDIENVGKTATHHTFFEMLGNFSIGDYFKEDAIKWGFEFLTDEKWLGFDKEKLYMTIYPTDENAYNTWINLGVDDSHIIKLETNFWEIGPGPSGPNSEIFYDRGEKYDPNNIGIDLLKKDIQNDRYVEIWNIVFSQYNATEGLEKRDYPELPSKNIDTGMGFERTLSVIQDTETNYDTDIFLPLMYKISEISGIEYTGQMSFKVIADHIRTIVFALSDGANFGNNGRNYILRRLLRRAVIHAKKININRYFMCELVPIIVEEMGDFYPNIRTEIRETSKKIEKEEELFHKTLESGLKRLEELFANNNDKKISGEDAFKLYDTYGFPFDLTEEYASERGFTVSKKEAAEYLEKQRLLARAARNVSEGMNMQNIDLLNYKESSKFVGYDTTEVCTNIIGLFDGEKITDKLSKPGFVVLNETPFYVESGGQVSDRGVLIINNNEYEVINLFKGPNNQVFHFINTETEININEQVNAIVDIETRNKIVKNHSAAHLLQKALKEVLGQHVHQAGSKVDEEMLRFDFTYDNKITDDQIIKIEDLVNEKIQQRSNSETKIMTLEEAKETGANAYFEEKYGDMVRVVIIGDSSELCGGTHVKNSGDIGSFAIASLENKGTNTYRITAATGYSVNILLNSAIKPYNDIMLKTLGKAKTIIEDAKKQEIILDFDIEIDHSQPKSYRDIIFNKSEMETIRQQVLNLEKTYEAKRIEKALTLVDKFIEYKKEINGINSIILKTEYDDIKPLKAIIDEITNRLDNSFIFIANVYNENVNFLAKMSENFKEKFNLGDIVREYSTKSGGNGGGNATFAAGGGTDATYVDQILILVEELLKQ